MTEDGLVRFMAAHCSDHRDHGGVFLDEVAAVVSGANSDLMNLSIDEALASLSGSKFFLVAHRLIELIPRLKVDACPLLQFVSKLVDKGGADGAANEPNRALRDWCAQDRRRSEAIYASARGGDHLAIRHLTFALEAALDIHEALRFSESQDIETRRGAVTALGRITSEREDAQRVVDRLATVALEDDDELTGLMALRAGYDALARESKLSRDALLASLKHRLSSASVEAIHLAADLMWLHGKSLNGSEFVVCLQAIAHVHPESGGTLKSLDRASYALKDSSRFYEVANIIRDILDGHNGSVRLESFNSFTHLLQNENVDRGKRIVIDWLMNGGFTSRNSLGSIFPGIDQSAPAFSVHGTDLPEGASAQAFLCRKAVAFLFLNPLTAATFPIAVLRNGDPAAFDEALEVLFDPLLICYGGLIDQLEIEIANNHPQANALKELVARKKALHDGAKGIEKLAELQPGELKRQIEHIRYTDESHRASKEAKNRSVLLDLVTTQHLLYGRKSVFYIEDDAGELRRNEIAMQEHSVSTEFPLLENIDPVGLALHLHHLRFEKKPEASE